MTLCQHAQPLNKARDMNVSMDSHSIRPEMQLFYKHARPLNKAWDKTLCQHGQPFNKARVCVYSGLTSLSTIFQSYHDGVWLRQGAQCYAASTIFYDFGMSQPGIEPVTSRSPERTLYQLSYRGGINKARGMTLCQHAQPLNKARDMTLCQHGQPLNKAIDMTLCQHAQPLNNARDMTLSQHGQPLNETRDRTEIEHFVSMHSHSIRPEIWLFVRMDSHSTRPDRWLFVSMDCDGQPLNKARDMTFVSMHSH